MRKGRTIINYGYGVNRMETMRKTCKYLGHKVSELRFKKRELWNMVTPNIHIFTTCYLPQIHYHILSFRSFMWWMFRSFTQLLDIQSTCATSQPGSHAQLLSVESTHILVSLTQITVYHCCITGIS